MTGVDSSDEGSGDAANADNERDCEVAEAERLAENRASVRLMVKF